jgi:flagellar hook-associated protein 3 FlgL
MRVTTKQITNTFTTNLFRQSEALLRAQEQLATEKRINRPSDDPVGLGKVLDYRTSLSAIGQYQRNIAQAKTHIETSETILNTVDDLLVEAKGIASEHASGAGDAATLSLAANQVDTIRNQIFDLANSQSGQRYIFAGRTSDSPAFTMDGAGTVTYAGDSAAGSDTRYVIGQGVTVNVAANGEAIFNGSEDVFGLLEDLRDELGQADPDTDVIADIQARIQGVIDNVRAVRADNGAVFNRLETTEGHLKKLELNLNNLRGDQEDLNIAQAAVELQALETNYEVLLAVGAKIVQPSLIDFL